MIVRAAVIIVLGFIAFGSMLPAPFRVMDDRVSIVENPAIKSLKNIPGIFREGYFHDQSYYRPLINLTFMGEYQVFGFNSFFYNLDNLILHILNALLVVLLVTKLTNNNSIGFWAGLLFVLHPIQWEAVCNIPGRAILLSAFFVLSSFVLFLEFYQHRRFFALFLVLITFFMGLLCKESAGVLPLVILMYLVGDKTRPAVEKFKYLWPFVVAIGGYLFLRKSFGITVVHQASQPMVLILGFVTFLRSVMTDLRLFFLPVDLHYDRSLPFMMSLKEPQAMGVCLFWASALFALLFSYRKIPIFILFLVLWFCLELLPVSQLVTSIGVGAGYVSTADHFLYLASIPVFIGMILSIRWLFEQNAKKAFVHISLLRLLVGGFLVFLLVTSVEQSIYASNEYTMINRSLSFEPNNPRLQGTMGMLSVFRDDIPDAEKHFRLAIKAEPLNPTFHIFLGSALCQQKKWIEGLEQFVAFDPGKNKDLVDRQTKMTMTHIQEQLKRGTTFDARGWLAIGIYYAKTGQNPRAIDAFLKTVSLNQHQPDAWFNLGSLYEAENNWPQAKTAYEKLLGLREASDFQKVFASQHVAVIGNK